MSAPAKPSLHEIAAMPFPASLEAMRKHYNKDWGKPVPEDGKKRKFKVQVEYSLSGNEIYEVEAFSREEAEDLAEEEFDIDGSVPDGADIDGIHIVEESSDVPS